MNKEKEDNSGILQYRISFKAEFEFINKVRTYSNINRSISKKCRTQV